jgi:tetratricopeptide (TPR) repeat protein
MWEKAIVYEQQVGEQALTLYAQRAAIDHLTRAVDSAHHLSLTPPSQVYRARGQAYETLGEFDRARGDYERALDAARTAHDGRMEWQSVMASAFCGPDAIMNRREPGSVRPSTLPRGLLTQRCVSGVSTAWAIG